MTWRDANLIRMIATNWSSERNVITKAVAHDAALTLRHIFKVSIFNHVKNSSKVKFESVMWLKRWLGVKMNNLDVKDTRIAGG